MKYPSHQSRSRALYEKAKQFMPGGNTRTTVFMKPYPIYAVKGEGCRVWDADGVERIDCINNFTSMIHGHVHPVINGAVRKQLELGTCFGMPTETEIELAELLTSRIESVETIRFANSGTEAVMMSIKAARAFTGRSKIAKVEGAYHGSYDYAEVSLDSSPNNWGEHAPASIAYTAGTPLGVTSDVIVLPFNNGVKARELILEHGKELAAILVDPMPNRAGLVPATQSYIKALREAATEVGALLIFDEVISFRLSTAGAQPMWNVSADITALGKIIGGGFPIGAIGGRSDVMSVFDPTSGKPALPHGGTFSANPISMAAGTAAMRLLDEEAFAHLSAIGDQLRNGINAAFDRHGIAGKAVGMGSLLRVHFKQGDVYDYRSAFLSQEDSRVVEVFHRGMLNRGVLSSYGLMALSTPMLGADVEEIIAAADGAIADVSVLF